MNDRIVGFVLKQMDYRDNDQIITVFTREYGKLSFVVAGAKKLSNKNAGSLIPYTKTEIQYDHKPNQSMFRLKTARCQEYYRNLHEDLEKSNVANIIAEVSDVLTLPLNEDGNSEYIYEKIEKSFEAIEGNHDLVTVVCLFLVDMMRIYGILPDVDECVLCGNTTVEAISISDGGFLCRDCANQNHIELKSSEDLKRFRLIVKGGLNHLEVIENATKATLDDLYILKEIIEKYTGFQFKSLALYYRLFTIE